MTISEISVLQAVSDLGKAFNDPVDCLGLDQKVLFLAEREGRALPIAKAYYRPMQEPVLLSFWDRLVMLDFDVQQALEISSLLVGSRQHIRKGPMVGRAPDGTGLMFARRPASGWIGRLQASANMTIGPIELAARLYQCLIVEHPFTDGNGRFSRAMIYAALGRSGLIRNPCLGLNGVFELHRDAMAIALGSGLQAGSIQPLISAVTALLEDAVRFARLMQSKGSRLRSIVK